MATPQPPHPPQHLLTDPLYLLSLSSEMSLLLASLTSGPPHLAVGPLSSLLLTLNVRLSDLSNDLTLNSTLEKEKATQIMDELLEPFLQVVIDETAQGPQTLQALQSLTNIVTKFPPESSSVQKILTQALQCRYEQTDERKDETIEMALSTFFISLILTTSTLPNPQTSLAFKSMYMTHQPTIHSPSLCYHTQTVCLKFLPHVFTNLHISENVDTALSLIKFLTNQLLHTFGNSSQPSWRDFCLQLLKTCVTSGCESSNQKKLYQIDCLLSHVREHVTYVILSISNQLVIDVNSGGGNSSSSNDKSVDNNHLLKSLPLSTLTLTCNLIKSLFMYPELTRLMKLQIHSIFNSIFIRVPLTLLDNTKVINTSHANVILSSLIDIMSVKPKNEDNNNTWLTNLYGNYDCDIYCNDVTTSLVKSLSMCCAHDPNNASIGVNVTNTSRETMIDRNLRLKCNTLLNISIRTFIDDYDDEPNFTAKNGESSALLIKNIKVKRIMTTAANMFNSKPINGLEFLQQNNLLPQPITTESVAEFLRDGLSCGLDKVVIGAFLGEAGKSEQQIRQRRKEGKKELHAVETEVFHQKLLRAYVKCFHFEGGKILGNLRGFLSCFRLPGEAQQIDRIIQAFAEECGPACHEFLNEDVFSDNTKKAVDTVYLLSFSIIMLNTDLHNPNIRPDRKMTLKAFMKNNSDYGKEIMDKPLPEWLLTEIYEEIQSEEIITKSDGPKGDMTPDRWKDCLRQAEYQGEGALIFDSGVFDKGIDRRVLACIWRPVLSVACANLLSMDSTPMERKNGADLALTLGKACCANGMTAVLDSIVAIMVSYTGLGVGGSEGEGEKIVKTTWFEENGDRWKMPVVWRGGNLAVEEAWGERSDSWELFRTQSGIDFANNRSRQTCCVAVFNIVGELSECLVNPVTWSFVLTLVLALRELNLIECKGFVETDSDLLSEKARAGLGEMLLLESIEFERRAGLVVRGGGLGGVKEEVGILGKIGGFFFGGGGGEEEEGEVGDEVEAEGQEVSSLVSDREVDITIDDVKNIDEIDYIWDCAADSEEEEDGSGGREEEEEIIVEDSTLLEVDGTPMRMITSGGKKQESKRARLRKLLRDQCKFEDLVRSTKFFPDASLLAFVEALKGVIGGREVEGAKGGGGEGEEWVTGGSKQTAAEIRRICAGEIFEGDGVSMGNKAWAEVLLCEVVLRNKDRIEKTWGAVAAHYEEVIGKALNFTYAVEKCACCLIRIISRMDGEGAWERLDFGLKLLTVGCDQKISDALVGHVVEGLWRVVNDVVLVGGGEENKGWVCLFDALEFCLDIDPGEEEEEGEEGEEGSGVDEKKFEVLVKCFKILHLLLHSSGLKMSYAMKKPICALIEVAAGVDGKWGGEDSSLEEWNYRSKIAVAGLDLLMLLYSKVTDTDGGNWREILEALAEFAMGASTTFIRQHALGLLMRWVIEGGEGAEKGELLAVIGEIAVPVGHERITSILGLEYDSLIECQDDVQAELMMSVSLVYKGLLQHLEGVLGVEGFVGVLEGALRVAEILVLGEGGERGREREEVGVYLNSPREFCLEAVKNVAMVINALGGGGGDAAKLVGGSMERMGLEELVGGVGEVGKEEVGKGEGEGEVGGGEASEET
ncbi:hypothetical protein TrLO_g1702 [Triparma laevis f. longispina]|uniref:SEC7 domain-containing protein n=1 Tax=Triparma laevis f. longispina TaxID=1714387 RepID=A0A9W7FRD3_9STRA|nr:hypothetical protein TrLO_g1702 [Triparma laevis f. longispina]